MNDQALSTVIAAMLVLGIAVTVYAVYTAEYLPAMKQQAEVEHLQKVQESMVRFGSALENAVSLKRTMVITEPVILGGGDILLHSSRSAGTIRVEEEIPPVMTISVSSPTINESYNLTMVNFSYWPIDNFWIDQGYRWQFGFINVSHVSGDRWYDEVPLHYPTMDQVQEMVNNSSLAKTLVDVQPYHSGQVDFVVYAVTMIPGQSHDFVSGNGIATLEINATVISKPYTGANVTFSIGDTHFKKPLSDKISEFPEIQNKSIILYLTTIEVSTVG